MKTRSVRFYNLCTIVLLLSSSGSLSASDARAAEPKFKAVAFDAFPVFDPRPIADLADEIFPEKGAELVKAWRNRQFEYQWLRALSGQYADFMQATEESLVFSVKLLGLNLLEADKQRLMSAYMNLSVWPDAKSSIEALHSAGVRIVFLSNMTEAMLKAGLERNHLDGAFEAVFSTDEIQSYKPDPKAYQLAVEKLNLSPGEILFVAFAGWDVAGAKWFGFPTFWVNRLGVPMEELGVLPDAAGRDLKALVDYVIPVSASKGP